MCNLVIFLLTGLSAPDKPMIVWENDTEHTLMARFSTKGGVPKHLMFHVKRDEGGESLPAIVKK